MSASKDAAHFGKLPAVSVSAANGQYRRENAVLMSPDRGGDRACLSVGRDL